jgi:hypothetical protein
MVSWQHKKCFSECKNKEDILFCISDWTSKKIFFREEIAGGIIPQPAVNGAARPLYPPY